MSRPLLLSLLLAAATATLAACGGSKCAPVPPGTRCIKAVAGDPCRGSISTADGDSKDCTPGLCAGGSFGFGTSVGRRCFWFPTEPLKELCGGADEICVPESTDACTGAIACLSNDDCKKGLCKQSGNIGYCAGSVGAASFTSSQGRCYYFDPKLQ